MNWCYERMKKKRENELLILTHMLMYECIQIYTCVFDCRATYVWATEEGIEYNSIQNVDYYLYCIVFFLPPFLCIFFDAFTTSFNFHGEKNFFIVGMKKSYSLGRFESSVSGNSTMNINRNRTVCQLKCRFMKSTKPTAKRLEFNTN